MKNKRKWKSLNRRGLAALLTLAMCLGTVPFTAFAAEDTHEHNQNGWNCEWVEPEQELNCQHEHDEDCYVPGEPVLECTDDHHDEDCYVPDEDVLTCENEDEDYEHDEDCYASGEAVLECDEDHHTEDCYAPGEPVLDCRHEHGEDCFSAAEGFWSCTPPVEDAADEADKDVVEDEDQFDNDGNQGVIVEDETFEDDDQTDVEDEGVFNDDEQQNDVEDEDEALIPDEVQAFLDAVAAIPEITPENAEEVAEYVYGEVSEYYEALLGTEYEDREDVQEAAEVYAAAVEAVDAALDMESEDFAVTARPYYEVFPNGVYGTEDTGVPAASERGYSGDTFVFNTLPIRQLSIGYYTNTYYPDAYYYHLKSTSDPNKIIDNIYYSVGRWTGSQGNGMPCFQVNIDTKEGAVGTARVQVLLVYYISELNGVAGQSGFFSRTMDCTIRVSAKTYTVTYTDGVTGEEIFTDQITRGLKFTDSIPEFDGIPEREGYTFNGWAPDLMETIEDAVAAGQAEEYYGYSEIVYTAQWEENDFKPEAPKRTDLNGILGNFVKVKCVSDPVDPGEKNQHENGDAKEYSTWGGDVGGKYESEVGKVYKDEDDWKVDVTLNGDVYAKMYSSEPVFGTGVTHTLAENEAATKTITLKWNADIEKWRAASGANKGTILAIFDVVCKVPETLYTVIYTDGADGESFRDEEHRNLKAGTATPSFNGGKNPTRDGYIFTGWLLTSVTPNKQGVQEKVAAEDANADHEIIYTAQWTENVKYTLTYDAKGGTPVPDKQEQENDPTFKISNVEPAKEGYIFKGWADDAKATEAKYKYDEYEKEITLEQDKPDKTIYAVWEADKSTAHITVTKTIQKQVKNGEDIGWTADSIGTLKDDDIVLYTVTVKNTGKLPLKDFEFFDVPLEKKLLDKLENGEISSFDEKDVKLEYVGKPQIQNGRTATYKYYAAKPEEGIVPLLYIATNQTLEANDTIVVQYMAKIINADGDNVENSVDVYATIDEDAYNAPSKMKAAAFRSSVGGSASTTTPSEGMTGEVTEGGGSGRPDRPTDGVSGGGGTSTGTEKPSVVPSNPALSVTKTADKTEASVGDVITYTVTVTNIGDVALTGVTVKDTMAGKVTFVGEDSFESFDLAVGETKTIEYTYVVTTNDAGETITNDVSVTSDEVTTSVQDRVTVTVKPVEPENVTITIEYVDEADKTTIGTFTKEFDKGNEYNVIDDIKAPEGYVIINIDGQTEGIADKNDTITVTCRKDEPSNATVTYPEYTDDNTTPVTQSDEVAPGTTIIVDPNGGLWTPPEGSEWDVEGDTFKHVAEAGEQIALTVPTKDGNVFVGWTKAEATDENGDKTITFTAQWVEADGRHTITVNRVHNGNTIVSIPVTVPDGEAYTVTDVDAPAAFDNGGNHYIRIDATLPTVPAGDEDVSVDVRYALDNIGGGTNGNSPDGIPDGQQAVVYYRSSNTAYGTVRDAYQMFDLRPDIASREETLRNAATVVGRARFTNWTMGSQALSTNATLENAFTVEAGHTYTVTANFTGYTGGGSSGGGGGGGGGGGSSSGNTNNNNTNNDTTTNDDVVTINDADVPLADLTSLNREDHFAYVSGYTDGTVRPTNNITREEVAAIFYRLLTDVSRTVYETGVNNFSDVDSSRWSNNAISTLANAGIISGYKEGTFKPGQTITRAEFAAIASRFDSVSENVTNPFTDTEGHWAEQLISNAADKGWVGGYPDSTFRPSNAITRAEAMTLINKVLNREVDKEGLLADAKQWPDNQEGKWYYYQVLEATNSHDYERRSADSYVENWTAITQK